MINYTGLPTLPSVDHGREWKEEFHHGLTMDESETSYWSFSEQQWFPLTMNVSGDFYWDYPHQTWSRFKRNVISIGGNN